MQIDTARAVEIRSSPTRLLLFALAALACTVPSFVMARAYAGTGSFREFIGWAGAVVMPAGALLLFWASRQARRGPTLILAPEGFRDIRLGRNYTPWSAVRGISVWQHPASPRVKAIVLKVAEITWQDLPLTPKTRWLRSANERLGIDGLPINTFELSMKLDDLLDLVKAYAAAHGAKAA